ncbi:winged helix-turn-helix domain-containing protein [Phytobacter diazotrophicus]|uniref:winged helix-turn-helix domain-containing protein n=1 Tax=Phytobacter diazotrophicus TaxID=395631 RepID=UPI002FF54F61
MQINITDSSSVYFLTKEKFRVKFSKNSYHVFNFTLINQSDFILLDIESPPQKGLELLQAMKRQSAVPVIVLSTLNNDRDIVNALSFGAEDYLVKPFSVAELVARLHVIRRRLQPAAGENAQTYNAHTVEIHRDTHQVFVGSQRKEISALLTPTEYRLLCHMIHQPMRVFSRSELLHHCLPDRDGSERAVDGHISNLRRKLSDLGVTLLLENVRGFGYRLGRVG